MNFGAIYLNFGAIYLNFGAKIENRVFSKGVGGGWVGPPGPPGGLGIEEKIFRPPLVKDNIKLGAMKSVRKKTKEVSDWSITF